MSKKQIKALEAKASEYLVRYEALKKQKQTGDVRMKLEFMKTDLRRYAYGLIEIGADPDVWLKYMDASEE